MPTPSRTSREHIVAVGAALLEEHGLVGLTMQAVAQRVGVRAPSLYKHVADRDALVALVADAAAADLGAHLEVHGDVGDMARALRGWAHARPASFRLLFSGVGSTEVFATASEPVLRASAALAGNDDALNAARLLTAWATGFISMELAGAFMLGGDVDTAFEYGIESIVASLQASSARRTHQETASGAMH